MNTKKVLSDTNIYLYIPSRAICPIQSNRKYVYNKRKQYIYKSISYG